MRAASTHLTRFSFAGEGEGEGGGGLEGDLGLVCADDGYEAALPVDDALMLRALGQPREALPALLERIHAEDKHVRKRAKTELKEVNARFRGIEGLFELAPGPRGLTVHALPPGAALSVSL